MDNRKPTYDYLYLERTKTINGQEHYGVIRVCLSGIDPYTAKMKARRYAREHKLGKLAGGSFTDQCKPHNFKTHYTVYKCPKSIKPTRESRRDKYIAALLEAEVNMRGVMIGFGRVWAF